VAQELAIARPDLVRSLVMTGTWAWADPVLGDQLCLLRDTHQQMGFAAFQMLAASYSFEGSFYNRNRDRLLGPTGTWSDLVDRYEAHARFVEASLTHDVRDRIASVTAPAIVLHAGKDPITTERHTRELEALMATCEGVYWPEATHVLAGRELRSRFDELLRDFLEKH
jgi:pimeloyl-ACP methyl ester carboxylesterase